DQAGRADRVEQTLRGLPDLDDSQHAAVGARDWHVDLGERGEDSVALDVDLDLPREGADEFVVAGKPLADELRLIGPEDLGVAAPHVDADDLGQRRDRRREDAPPAFPCRAVARVGEDPLETLALDLASNQCRGVLPLPVRDRLGQQRRDRVPHAAAEDERPEQTQHGKSREDRMFEQVHPRGTGAIAVPRFTTYRWGAAATDPAIT